MISILKSAPKIKKNITHSNNKDSVNLILNNIKDKIHKRGDTELASVKEQLEILDDLASFDLGMFLLMNRGLNGFWTDYIINYPKTTEAKKNKLLNNSLLSKMEKFLLFDAPVTLAHRQRYKIFQEETSKRLVEGSNIASIPCGCMRDMLELDYSKLNNYQITGLDIDANSIRLSENLSLEIGLNEYTNFIENDAWKMNLAEEFDIITSSGLNVYENDKNRVLELYRTFYSSLKLGGALILSVLTYPPAFEDKCKWNLAHLKEENHRLESVIFGLILETKWLNFRTEAEIYQELELAGFTTIEFIYDDVKMFPTVVASK